MDDHFRRGIVLLWCVRALACVSISSTPTTCLVQNIFILLNVGSANCLKMFEELLFPEYEEMKRGSQVHYAFHGVYYCRGGSIFLLQVRARGNVLLYQTFTSGGAFEMCGWCRLARSICIKEALETGNCTRTQDEKTIAAILVSILSNSSRCFPPAD